MTLADLKFLVGVLKSTSKLFKLRSQTRRVAGNICFRNISFIWKVGTMQLLFDYFIAAHLFSSILSISSSLWTAASSRRRTWYLALNRITLQHLTDGIIHIWFLLYTHLREDRIKLAGSDIVCVLATMPRSINPILQLVVALQKKTHLESVKQFISLRVWSRRVDSEAGSVERRLD